MTALEGTVNGHLVECAKNTQRVVNGLETLNEGHRTILHKIDTLERLPIRAFRWLGGILFAAIVTVLTQNYILHEQTVNAAKQAAADSHQAAVQASAANSKLSQIAP